MSRYRNARKQPSPDEIVMNFRRKKTKKNKKKKGNQQYQIAPLNDMTQIKKS